MNKINKYYKIASVLFTLLLIVSCSEGFLKPEPLDFYAPENVLVTQEGLESVLDNALSNFRNEFCSDQAPFVTDNKYSDMGVDCATDKTTCWQDLKNQMLPDGILNGNGTTRIGWFWDKSFFIIKDCNTVISRIDDAKYSSDAAKNALLGSAYFLRAYRYYEKTMQFGDVPLVLEEFNEPNVEFYTTTKESIWKKMIKDLEFAIQHVPEADKVNRGKVTKAACKHLLAKYYLLEGRFDDAIKMTSEIINGGVHNLVTQRFGIDRDIDNKDVIWDLFRIENKSLTENTEGLLMTIDRYGMEGGSKGIFTMRNIVPNYGGVGVIKTPLGANGMTDKAGAEIGLVEKYGRGARFRPTWYTTNGVWTMNNIEDTIDYRHRTDNGNWMTMEKLVYNNPTLKGKDPWYGKNLRLYSDEGTLLCMDTINAWYSWPHYKSWAIDPDRVQPFGGPGDWYIYRLAETYLLRAEAYIWKGEYRKAADDINIIRNRANAQYMYTASDIQNETIGAILDERARELYHEELRHVELVRLSIIYARTGIPCYNGKTYKYGNLSEDNFWYDRVNEKNNFYNKGVKTPPDNYFTCASYNVFWPIPADAINTNTGGVINQNIGYPGTEKNVPPLEYTEP